MRRPTGLQRLHSGNAGAVFGKAAAGEVERTKTWDLLRPWDLPGESTGVGCRCLLCRKTWRKLKCVLRNERSQSQMAAGA